MVFKDEISCPPHDVSTKSQTLDRQIDIDKRYQIQNNGDTKLFVINFPEIQSQKVLNIEYMYTLIRIILWRKSKLKVKISRDNDEPTIHPSYCKFARISVPGNH